MSSMSRRKGKNTKPEMLVRKFLHANGFCYKLNDNSRRENRILFYTICFIVSKTVNAKTLK
jgi:G:T-mismatch repair DNA endonuclease (very short patch repair protein)